MSVIVVVICVSVFAVVVVVIALSVVVDGAGIGRADGRVRLSGAGPDARTGLILQMR